MKKWHLAAKISMALIAPVIVLGIAELLLRSVGAGYPTGFLLSAEIADQPYLVNNPFYGYRFFQPELARNPAPIAIEQEKPASQIRVAVLGESAAQGDPMLEYGMPRMLEKMLNAMAPTGNYVVINTAMTAINSHVIVDIAREIITAKPDIAVIYMGNNEVIGPYGPGTVFTAFPGAQKLNPLRVAATRLKLTQARYAFTGATQKQWTGLDMFAGILFQEGDPVLETMYKGYRSNLETIVELFHENGVRVLLSTVAVNLADCPPFGSENSDADDLYREGQELMASGHHEQAISILRKARDRDNQRFRTDDRINEIIRETSESHDVELVDAETAFNFTSGKPCAPGADYFLDHVHFTFTGTWLLSRQLAAAILNEKPEAAPSLEACRDMMFFTPWAERQQALVMLDRRKRPPLNHQSNNAAQIERLTKVIQTCSDTIKKVNASDVEADYQRLSKSNPDDFFIPFHWGAILAESGRWKEAVPVLTNAVARVPMHFEARMLPAAALCRAGQPEAGARLIVGQSQPYGYYLSDYGTQVMRSLYEDGYPSEARRFQAEVLKQARRFPRRSAFAAYHE